MDQSAVCKWPWGLLVHSVAESELSCIILAVQVPYWTFLLCPAFNLR